MTTIEAQRADARDLKIQEMKEELDVIPELSGIRDDLRAGRDRLALDRLTRFLDRNGECWHAVAPIADPASLAFDWGQR